MKDLTITQLRDQFAMAALTGLLAVPDTNVGSVEVYKNMARVSKFAYQYADAMLKARG